MKHIFLILLVALSISAKAQTPIYLAEMEQNTVIQVIVVDSSFCTVNNIFSESNCGNGQYLITDINSVFRKNYAGIDYTYNAELNAFIPPKPIGENWQLDSTIFQWYNTNTPNPFDE